MALNGDLLGDEILAALDAAVANNPEVSQAQRSAIWRAIGTAIVTHIQTNAVVSTSVAVVSVSGVTPGAGTSGPGTGSGTGTVG